MATTTNGTKKNSNGLTWNDLFLNGDVIKLTRGMWRARIGIRPVDLGIENTDAVNKALNLGVARLAPKEAFEAIDAVADAAKRAVEDGSYAFGFIHGARYIPGQNREKLLAKLDDLKTQFDAAVEAFIGTYEAVKAEQLPIIEKALQDAARTPEAALAALDRIRSEYPPADSLRDLFVLRRSVYAITGSKVAGASEAVGDETNEVRDVVRDMVVGLRGEVAEKLGTVLALIQKGGSLKEVSINSALAVLDRVDAVNVLGDDALTAKVASLRSALRGVTPGKRVTDAEVAGLEAINKDLTGSVEEAMRAAEAKLTGRQGRRLATASVVEGRA